MNNFLLILKDILLWILIIFSMYILLYGIASPTWMKILYSFLSYFILIGLVLIYTLFIIPNEYRESVKVAKIGPLDLAEDITFFFLTMILLLFLLHFGTTNISLTELTLKKSVSFFLKDNVISIDDLSFAFAFTGLVTITYSMVNNFKLYFNYKVFLRTITFNIFISLFIYKFTVSEIGEVVKLIDEHPEATIGLLFITGIILIGTGKKEEENLIKKYLGKVILKNTSRIFLGSATLLITTILVNYI